MRSDHADPSFKALIFDVDGTLAETEELHRQAFNRSFADLRLDWVWDRDLYRRLLAVAGGKERVRHFIDACGARPELDADAIATLHNIKTRYYTDWLAAGAVTLRPGVERLLREARRAGLHLAIATTTTRANIDALLTATLGPDGRRWFSAIGAADSAIAKKPAPDVYLFVLERLGLRGSDCVAFEDTSNGLASAGAAGIPTVVTISEYGDTCPFRGALAVVDHLGEPDAPCSVIAGRPAQDGCVDLVTLARWRLSE
jgi:beta-phosphoglucomutase-like phosphatase (HAD superfamily)